MKTKQFIHYLLDISRCKGMLSMLALAFIGIVPAKSQNITFNLLQQPCNANGILVFDFTTVTLPCTVQMNSNGNVTSYSLNATSDTIYSYSGTNVSIYIYDGLGNYAQGSFSSPPFTYSVSSTPAVCPAPGTVTATITGGVAPYTVQWYDLSMTTLFATGNPASLPAGDYSVHITDANGCVYGSMYTGDSVYVANVSGISLSLTSTPASCNNGTVSINTLTGGTPPYTYAWTNGSTAASLSGLSEGYYGLTVTDVNGCYETYYEYVYQNLYLNVNSVTSPATCQQNNGSVMSFASGGTPPYTYSYSTGANTQSVNGLTAGMYQVNVTDATGCHGSGLFTISATTPITVTNVVTPSSCTAPSGSGTLTINNGTPPYITTWYTSPVQTGTTISAVPAGTYSFNIIDAVGCVRTGSVYIPVINPLYGNASGSLTLCNTSNGTCYMNAWGGTPPFSYAWNNGATTATNNSLPVGTYSCTVTDAAGCSVSKTASVGILSPISIGFSTTPASCVYTSDGAITSVATGGTPPYTYAWSTGAGSASVSGLPKGNYTLTVTDAAGCSKTKTVQVGYNAANNSCYCTIEGTAYHDANSNCIQDAGENGIHNIKIHCGGFGYVYTDINGHYAFKVPSGNYTLSEPAQGFYLLSPCQNNSISITATASSGCTYTYDFANTINPIHDLHILNTYLIPPVPGNPFNLLTVVSNYGSVVENSIQLGFKHDGQLPFLGSAQVPYTQVNMVAEPNWYSVSSAFPTLAPSGSYSITNQFMTPTNIPIGTNVWITDTVSSQAPVSSWVNDYTPWNNLKYSFPTVVGSYDPNCKEVIPKGVGPQGYISPNEKELEYVIHFQNTGTWPAQKVVLTDTLDQDLNWLTLKPGWSNHNYIASLSEDGVLTFTFNNINLPDSASNPLGSIGVVAYTIEPNAALPNGTEIENTAAIYFDYNAPIITNTTLNTISDSLNSVSEKESESIEVVLYPNPASSQVSVELLLTNGGDFITTDVLDITGKIISTTTGKSVTGKNIFSFNTAEWSRGIYFVRLQAGDSLITRKLILN